MNAQTHSKQVETYLRSLGEALGDAPAAMRSAALDDVRAHVAEAQDSGRSVEEALAGLGGPEVFASQYLAELDPATTGADTNWQRAARAAWLLQAAGLAVAILTAAFSGFLMRGGGQAALLSLIPIAIVALGLVLPPRYRPAYAWASAATVTAFAVIVTVLPAALISVAEYLPLLLILWLAAVTPWRLSRGIGPREARTWRWVGAAVVALPVVWMGIAGFNGTFGLDWAAWAVLAVLLAVAVWFGLGSRIAAAAVALAGAILMAAPFLDGGFLMLLWWWIGGLLLAAGLPSVVAGRGRG
ncbi:putative membrane protein [Leucobacter komagatae]|uniref:Putative membrane protein n=1 Tax=Leucobacter komagatae TaxID=55969 RepID=A0A542XY52_9MICO|nr:hypothetical protein [Leucobacter komagatae]TQL40663.1 putative membrane protein [Leucobacter komagatae]